jgi:predicted nucleic acid-binding protein
MIILDTNVVSEPTRQSPDATVVKWLNEQRVETLYLTSVNVAELLIGIEMLPNGRRKASFRSSLMSLIARHIGKRVLAFDDPAAREYVRLTLLARKNGKAVSFADGQIASIASHHGFKVATRDEAPFKAMGVDVINPWNESG